MPASVSSVLYTVASESVGIARRTAAWSSSALGCRSVAASSRKMARRCGVTASRAVRQRATKASSRSRRSGRRIRRNFIGGKSLVKRRAACPATPGAGDRAGRGVELLGAGVPIGGGELAEDGEALWRHREPGRAAARDEGLEPVAEERASHTEKLYRGKITCQATRRVSRSPAPESFSWWRRAR